MSATDGSSVAALSPRRWRQDAAALDREHFDVLVIGGGIVGAGVALDAATRGLSVALVEAEDFASGTSSRSSKLIHGGLRYVQHRQFGLVREALRERSILLDLAPHLVRPTRFLYPLRHRIERPYVAAGVALYDLLARMPGAPSALAKAEHLGASAARAAAPSLRREQVTGAVTYSDAQVDDARLVISVIRSAASAGARILNRTRVVEFIAPEERRHGVRVRLETGEEVVVRARVVVAATGAWGGEIAALATTEALQLRPSKGVHLVVARSRIDTAHTLILPTEKSVLFVLPWGAHWIVGTTDTAWRGRPDDALASGAEIDGLLGELNAHLVAPIRREDIEATYAGIRPLVDGGARTTVQLSREHAVVVPRPGLVLVAGGKYTTYRVMAKDALDAALSSAGIASMPCRTDSIGIAGRVGYAELSSSVSDLASTCGLSATTLERLLGRYGGLVPEVLAVESCSEPLRALGGAPGYLRAEVAYAVTHEGARHLDDVIARRTRTAIEVADRGVAAAEEIAGVMAPLLGWSNATTTAELAAWSTEVDRTHAAEIGVEEEL